MNPDIENIKKDKKIRVGLVFKVTAIITLLIAIVSASSVFLIYYLSYAALKDEVADKLKMIAASSASMMNGDKLSTIKSAEDEGNQTYLELQRQLQSIKQANEGKLRYIYTIGKLEDSYVYILDAAPIDDLENHSSIGDEFAIDEFPEALNGFLIPTVEKNPTFDSEFNLWSQSGYAPIKDSKGNVIGAIGLDMDISTLKAEEAKMREAGITAFSTAFLLALLLGIIFSRYLTRPILQLTKATKEIAEGNLNTTVSINRNDEFGILAASFNAMTQDIKISHEELKSYNLELEDKVAQRTAQISAINKEIKDILDNMSQAIFTIDQNLIFNAQHSKYATEIFGDITFEEKSILDVFFSLESQRISCDNMSNWLRKVFENTGTRWEDLEALQPVREIGIKAKDKTGKETTKYIQVDFQPIMDIFAPDYKEKVTKVMVIVQDITEKKTLELAMEVKEQEYKDNINQIVEIINMDQELFQDFVNECKENLIKFEPKLIALKDDRGNTEIINELFRIMHTIKGNAKIFNLEKISGAAHSIENIFSSIRKGETIMNDDLLDETFSKLDRFNELFSETMDIYNKIVQGKNNTSVESNEDTHKEENEVIKVKLQELNRLSELIKKADRMILEDISKDMEKQYNKDKVSEIENIFKETEKQLETLKKISFSRLLARFPRMVRDISTKLGKKAKLITKGENVDVDKNVFDKIADPLVHILRNSLDHGLETPQERVQLGKPEEGTIEMNISMTQSELSVEIRDDGKGLDLDRIKAKAVKKGLITPEKALEMEEEEASSLIFSPGFSTNDSITDLSGRGVGMDVVKKSIEEGLNGKIELETNKNKGLKITLKIPLAS